MGRRLRGWGIVLGRRAARGAALLLPAFVLFAVLRGTGVWHPTRIGDYVITAVVCAVAVAVGRALPATLLLGVAIVVSWPLWLFGVVEVRAIPLALAAFLAASGGLRAGVALPIAIAGAFFTDYPGWVYVVPHPDEWGDFVLGTDVSTGLLTLGIVVASVLLGRASYVQRRDAAALRARNDELARLRESDRERIANEERTAIAREIHDVVAHHLAAIVIRAQAAARVAEERPMEPRAAVEWIAQSGQQALGEMRGVVRVLRGSATEPGPAAPMLLADAIEDVVDRIRAAGVEVRAEVVVPHGLSAVQEFAVLRVCQEALTNVLIHSGATAAEVRLRSVGGEAVLTVDDEGAGGPSRPRGRVPDGIGSGGAGIRGMRERAEAAGGLLTAGRRERGWRVELTLPVGETPPPAEQGTRGVWARVLRPARQGEGEDA